MQLLQKNMVKTRPQTNDKPHYPSTPGGVRFVEIKANCSWKTNRNNKTKVTKSTKKIRAQYFSFQYKRSLAYFRIFYVPLTTSYKRWLSMTSVHEYGKITVEHVKNFPTSFVPFHCRSLRNFLRKWFTSSFRFLFQRRKGIKSSDWLPITDSIRIRV